MLVDRGFVLVAVVAVLSGACSSAANGGQRADAGAESGADTGAESGADAGDGACPSQPDAGYGPCEKGNVIVPKGGTYLTEDGCQACTCTSDGGCVVQGAAVRSRLRRLRIVYDEGLLNAQGCASRFGRTAKNSACIVLSVVVNGGTAAMLVPRSRPTT